MPKTVTRLKVRQGGCARSQSGGLVAALGQPVSRGLPGRRYASCFPPTKGQWLFLARASQHRTLSIKLTMILWRLTLLSCFLLLAAAFPFHEVNWILDGFFFIKIGLYLPHIVCEMNIWNCSNSPKGLHYVPVILFQQSTSSSPGVQPRPGPHHSLATLLYSVVMQVTLEFKCPGDSAFAIYSFQDEAEDADISALPWSEIQDWTNISI